MKTLKTRLQKEVKKAYLVTGDDFYLFEKSLSMLRSALKIEMGDLNISYFDDDNFNALKVVEACDLVPIGDEKRLVVLKYVSKVSEGDKKILQSYLEQPNETSCLLVLDIHGKFDCLKKNIDFVDAKRMDRAMVSRIVFSDLQKRERQISPEALDCLIDSCNGYLTKIQNELDKLCAYTTKEELITKKVIDALVTKDLEYTIFELTDALSQRNGDKAIEILNLMGKEQGVLSLISNHFRRLFYIGVSEMSNQELANVLGVKEYAILKSRKQVNNFSKFQLKKIVNLTEEVDFFIKSGKMQAENALYYLVFNILFI